MCSVTMRKCNEFTRTGVKTTADCYRQQGSPFGPRVSPTGTETRQNCNISCRSDCGRHFRFKPNSLDEGTEFRQTALTIHASLKFVVGYEMQILPIQRDGKFSSRQWNIEAAMAVEPTRTGAALVGHSQKNCLKAYMVYSKLSFEPPCL